MCILRGKEYDYGSIGMFFDSIFEYSNACVATASTRETNPMSHHVNLHFVRTSIYGIHSSCILWSWGNYDDSL